MRVTLEALTPTGQRDSNEAKAQRAEIVRALTTLGLSASIEKERLRVCIYRGFFWGKDKKVELVRSIITDLLGLEIDRESVDY